MFHYQGDYKMYGLKRDTDLRFFMGKTLLQVCFGAHEVIFNFEGDLRVTVMSSLNCAGMAVVVEISEKLFKIIPRVLKSIGQAVASVEVESNGALRLVFEDGNYILIYDDSSEYESYTIRFGEHMIVV